MESAHLAGWKRTVLRGGEVSRGGGRHPKKVHKGKRRTKEKK